MIHDYEPMSREDREDTMTTLESTTGKCSRHLCACGCGRYINIPTDPIRCSCLGCERPVNPMDIN